MLLFTLLPGSRPDQIKSQTPGCHQQQTKQNQAEPSDQALVSGSECLDGSKKQMLHLPWTPTGSVSSDAACCREKTRIFTEHPYRPLLLLLLPKQHSVPTTDITTHLQIPCHLIGKTWASVDFIYVGPTSSVVRDWCVPLLSGAAWESSFLNRVLPKHGKSIQKRLCEAT